MRSRTAARVLALCLLAPIARAEPLVGPSVGNADVFISEGNHLYNQKKYAKAASVFLKATRANPAAIQAYLGLARSNLGAKQTQTACNAYRAYLKASPESAERIKAQGELQLCERKLRARRKKKADPYPAFVETKALFFSALEEKALLGSGSASAALRSLVQGGYVGADLAEIGGKLNAAATAAAEDVYKRAMAKERLTVEALRQGKQLFQLAVDTGPAPANFGSHSSFLEGLADFQSREPKKAEMLFAEASLAEPGVAEYKFYRAIALYRSGDKSGALHALETDLPQDPRTTVLREALSLANSPQSAAVDLEQILFSKRFPAGR